MAIGGLEDIDLPGPIGPDLRRTPFRAVILPIPTDQDHGGRPTPRMRMHLIRRITGEEMMEEQRRPGPFGVRIPAGRKVSDQVRPPVPVDPLTRQARGELLAPRPRDRPAYEAHLDLACVPDFPRRLAPVMRFAERL